MRKRILLISGIIALALILMTGACAAEETPPGTAPVTVTTVADTVTPAATETTLASTVKETSVPLVPEVYGDAADDDIAPYTGPIGPGSPLYGLKIAFEDLDESFTFNETERFNKQLNNARLRLSEVRSELALNNTGTADRALEIYWQKVNLTQVRMDVLSSSNATGLLHAQAMITKHQRVLQNLMLSHPNNTGLSRAYNNSLALERKFEQKTNMKFERVMVKNNATILKAVRLEIRERERSELAGEEQKGTVQQTQRTRQAGGNAKPDTSGKGTGVTVQETEGAAGTGAAATPGDTGNEGQENQGNTGNTGKNNRGQGNGRNK